MLTLEQIQTMYPMLGERNRKHLLVEYVQCELLDSLFKQPESNHLSFIGGTAIRIMYEGKRFSEDLDFDNFGLTFEVFQKVLTRVVQDMRTKGFLVEFRFVEKMAYHCYVQFPELLHESGLSDMPEEKLLVRIDTVRKEKIFDPEIRTLDRFDLYRDIQVNPIRVILAQELITILDRKREKGRDLYDASVLWGRTDPDMGYVRKITGMRQAEFWSAFLSRVESLNVNVLATDVEPFLMDAKQADRVRTFIRYVHEKIHNLA